MEAIINTVHLLLLSIGISDVRVFLGQTDAQRLSDEMFDNDFRSCMDKTHEEIESDLKAYSSLTVAQGQIRLNPGIKRGIKAMVQWKRDMYRTDINPNTVSIPVFNNANTI